MAKKCGFSIEKIVRYEYLKDKKKKGMKRPNVCILQIRSWIVERGWARKGSGGMFKQTYKFNICV